MLTAKIKIWKRIPYKLGIFMATKDYSNKQESLVSEFLGWKKVTGSGAATCTAGDVISDKFLGECKTHEKPNSKVIFRQDVWNKISQESMIFGRVPVLFADDGTQNFRRTYCLTKKLADMSILPKQEFLVTDYNVNFKKQLNFDPNKIYAKFKKQNNLVLIIPWIEDVLLMNLETFNEFQINKR